jgi:intein/homing endonuclease
LDTNVNVKRNGVDYTIMFGDVAVGDKIESNNASYNTVLSKTKIVKKKIYKITTASGRTIRCSAKHLYPVFDSSTTEKSIDTGLCVGDKLFIKSISNISNTIQQGGSI